MWIKPATNIQATIIQMKRYETTERSEQVKNQPINKLFHKHTKKWLLVTQPITYQLH